MRIVALLAALGAILGQPAQPPGQETPEPEQPEADGGTAADGDRQAEQEQAEQEQAEQEQAEQAEEQQAEANPSLPAEQPAEADGNDAAAALDEARWGTGSMPTSWVFMSRRAVATLYGRTYGPFTVEQVHPQYPALIMIVAVEGSLSPERWGVAEGQLHAWMCAEDARVVVSSGGHYVITLHDGTGASRTVTITECEAAPDLAR